MKKTEELTYSPITGIIYWADVRHIEGDEQYVVCVGEKRDVTKNALKAVYQHFLDKAKKVRMAYTAFDLVLTNRGCVWKYQRRKTMRLIDADALLEKLDNINPVDYGAMSSYEAPTLSLNTLRDAIYEDAVSHGLWDWAGSYKEMDNLRIECTEFIAEEVLELSEACKSEREYSEELADVIIMALSVAGKLGIDIDAAVRRKMEINKKRPWRHEVRKDESHLD